MYREHRQTGAGMQSDTGDTGVQPGIIRDGRHATARSPRWTAGRGAGRRAKELMRHFEAELGGILSDGQKVAVARAVTALAEHLRGRALAGEPVSLDDLIRCDRWAALAVRVLALLSASPSPRLRPIPAW